MARDFDRRTLRFTDAQLEDEFRRQYVPGALASIRLSIITSIALWAVVLVLLPLVATRGVTLARQVLY